jgi:hypothetical protein
VSAPGANLHRRYVGVSQFPLVAACISPRTAEHYAGRSNAQLFGEPSAVVEDGFWIGAR